MWRWWADRWTIPRTAVPGRLARVPKKTQVILQYSRYNHKMTIRFALLLIFKYRYDTERNVVSAHAHKFKVSSRRVWSWQSPDFSGRFSLDFFLDNLAQVQSYLCIEQSYQFTDLVKLGSTCIVPVVKWLTNIGVLTFFFYHMCRTVSIMQSLIPIDTPSHHHTPTLFLPVTQSV